MKTALMQGQFNLKCLDQRFTETLVLDRKKILLGSGDHCDFKISDKSVSSMHAFLFLKGGDGFMVKDLYSEGGVFVNGKRVDESYVGAGDVLTIGTLSFSVEGVEDCPPVFNPDADVATTVSTPSFVELPPRPGLIFIDGEYCDIHFDESKYKPMTSVTKFNESIGEEYVELDESLDALEISHAVKDKRLEIINYMNGLMMDVAYYELKNGDYYLDSKKGKKNLPFNSLERAKIFHIKEGKLRFYPHDKISPSVPWEQVDFKDPVFLTHGAEQISLRLVDQGIAWNGIPLLYRDREFFKQSAKVFAMFFVPLLLLLFVGIPTKMEEVKELAVVYKLPDPIRAEQPTESTEKSEVAAEEVTSKTENTGHKETQQQPTKVEFAAASQNKKVVAKSAAPTPAPAAPVTPVKAYEFKSNVAMGSLVADSKINSAEGKVGGGSNSATKDASFNTGTSEDGAMVAGANVGVSKFNGSDSKGSGSGSYGSKGLAAKKGFDSSYLEPKTVVLGSMDPELLRKILREYIPQFRHCYNQELIGKSEKVRGILDLNFTISAAGKVSKYAVKMKDAQFSQKGIGCMGQVLSLIEFPKPKGGGVVDVRQPLNFFAETEKI